MRRAALLFACALLLLFGADCRRAPGPARAEPRAQSRLAPILRFHPPADGLLTDAQIEKYLRVRRAAKGRPEGEAASAVGVDAEEYAWVRTRVVEAVAALDEKRVRGAAEETYARTLASLRETRRSVKDRETLRTIDEQIAGLERERASVRRPAPLPPAISANARRIASRRAEIDSVSP